MLRNAIPLAALAAIVAMAFGAAYSAWPTTVPAQKPEVMRFYDPLP